MKTVPTSTRSLLVSMLCALMLWAVPQTASAYNWKFCLRWNVSSTDTGIGEDYYPISTGAPARNALVHWSGPPPSGLSGFRRLDGNGCFNLSSNHSSGFTFKLYADLKMGQTGNIRVKGFASESDKSNGTVTRWTIYSGNLGGSGGTRYFYVPVDPMGRLMGYGQWAVKRLDENYTPRISENHSMDLILATCPSLPGASCGSEPTIYINPGSENYKFLIGHEIGHWFHDVWGSLYGWGYKGTRGNDNDCWFPNEDHLGNHALRSLEYAGGAYTEGTAHFLSTLAFNHAVDVAWFRYYKEAVVDDDLVDPAVAAAYADLEQGNFRVNVENGGDGYSGGVTAWMRNKCPTEASWGGYSVEMDWLRFWWDVRTNYTAQSNGTVISPLSTRQIFDFLRYTTVNNAWENSNAKDTWTRLNESIAEPNAGLLHFTSTFRSLADWNGVNY